MFGVLRRNLFMTNIFEGKINRLRKAFIEEIMRQVDRNRKICNI